MAILVSALWQNLLMLSGDGRRKVQASSKSVGEVHKLPMITVVAAHCNVVSCLVTLADPVALGPGWSLCVGKHQRSMAYSALGSATLM